MWANEIRIVCSRCGAVKRADNHWWLLRRKGASLLIIPLKRRPMAYRFGVTEERALCGEACVAKDMSEFLGDKQWPRPKDGK